MEHGRKVLVGDFSNGDTIRSFAEAALGTLASDRFVLAGFSMGGYVALEMMRLAPQRVAALALLDTSARPDSPEAFAVRQKAIAKAPNEFDQVVQDLIPRLIHPTRAKDAPLIDSIVQMAARVGRGAFVRQQKAIMGRIDSRPSLRSIRCPVLVLCGDGDVITPRECSEEMASLISGARLEIIRNCGHLSLLEKPAEVNVALLSLISCL